VVEGILLGGFELFLVSVRDVVGVFVAVALADHSLGDVGAVREKNVAEKPAVLVAVSLGGVAFESDFLAEDELGHPFRDLAGEALDGLAAINDPRGGEADQADALLLAIYENVNGVAVYDFGDGEVSGDGVGLRLAYGTWTQERRRCERDNG
jgi:hypothetical protein